MGSRSIFCNIYPPIYLSLYYYIFLYPIAIEIYDFRYIKRYTYPCCTEYGKGEKRLTVYLVRIQSVQGFLLNAQAQNKNYKCYCLLLWELNILFLQVS